MVMIAAPTFPFGRSIWSRSTGTPCDHASNDDEASRPLSFIASSMRSLAG